MLLEILKEKNLTNPVTTFSNKVENGFLTTQTQRKNNVHQFNGYIWHFLAVIL